MQKLRRIPFFDRHVVKAEGSDVHPGIQKLNVCCTAGGSDYLWLGDAGGEVRCLSKTFDLSPPKQLFDLELNDIQVAQDGGRLVASGSDEGGVAKYKVFDVRNVTPQLLKAHTLFPSKGADQRATCIASSNGCGFIAVGTDTGAICLYRAGDLGQEKPAITILGVEGDPPVTGVHFLEKGSRIVLFACNMLCIRSWTVQDGIDIEVRLLHTDPSNGAAENCSCVLPVVNALMVANEEAVFSYDPDEGNMAAMPLEGGKMILTQYKSYFVAVTVESNANALQGVSPSPSTMPKQNVTVCLMYPQVRFMAFSAQFTDVVHVVTALGSIFVLSRGGADSNTVMFELREKELSEQLDILVKKRMFEWAAELAVQGGASPKASAEIYKEHGDALFGKRAHDQALAVYMKAVDLGLPLEPSYVVERYLDAQRIAHVAKYLKRLHEKNVAEREHTALLMKCYTKLKDAAALEVFLAETPITRYDVATAIEVLEGAGYYRFAADVTRKPEVPLHAEYVRISLEHFRNYSSVVEYIRGLPGDLACSLLLQHGKALVKNAPREAADLIRFLCGHRDDPSGAATTLQVRDLQPMFVGRQAELEAFLRSAFLSPTGCTLPPAEAERLFPILLELMVRTYAELDARIADEGEETAREARRLHAEIMRLIRQYQSEEALASSLMLSQTYGFVDGFFHAAEKLGRFQLQMEWCFEQRDAKRLMEVCKRSGQLDQSLWVQALSFLTSDEGADHAEAISEVLRHIETSDLMPLLMVIETLQQKGGMTLGDVKPYLQSQFKRLTDSVETSHGNASQDRQEIVRMQEEVTSLRTKAQIFQSTKCFMCFLALEVPAVHFFCGHSYHSYCVPVDAGCPKCSAEALPKISLREQREAQALNTEGFFKYHGGTSGDKQIQAVAEWCKFGAFDAGGATMGPPAGDSDAEDDDSDS